MRIFTEQALKEFAQTHPESKVALQVWSKAVKKSDWKNFADVKKTFNSVDAIGGQRYVFNVKGNEYSLDKPERSSSSPRSPSGPTYFSRNEQPSSTPV